MTSVATSGRTRLERDEWALAGDLASGIPRGQVALALYAAKVNHGRVEGVDPR